MVTIRAGLVITRIPVMYSSRPVLVSRHLKGLVYWPSALKYLTGDFSQCNGITTSWLLWSFTHFYKLCFFSICIAVDGISILFIRVIWNHLMLHKVLVLRKTLVHVTWVVWIPTIIIIASIVTTSFCTFPWLLQFVSTSSVDCATWLVTENVQSVTLNSADLLTACNLSSPAVYRTAGNNYSQF